jgi:hypothetical protein
MLHVVMSIFCIGCYKSNYHTIASFICIGELIHIVKCPTIINLLVQCCHIYFRNYTQDWYITTNWINHTIKIDMTTCNIENAKGKCLYDFLYVYVGMYIYHLSYVSLSPSAIIDEQIILFNFPLSGVSLILFFVYLVHFVVY